ncbi:MFS transporter [Lactobacillus sp. CC-MHH1034]|nr:MFS transporter [Agrilactobacillus fermenti]
MTQILMNKSKTHAIGPIISVALLSFMGVLTETSMNVTFPALMKQFGVSLTTVQWVTTGYLLTVALLMITSAYLKRRFTNRLLFVTAALLFIIGDLLCALAPTFWLLLLGRLIQAGCVGLAAPLMVNIILDTVPRNKLGTYMGLANLIILIAPALGPTFGGTMVYLSDWRMIFWSTLPLAIILLLVGQGLIKQYTPTKRISFAWGQFVFLSIGLVSLIIGLNELSSPSHYIRVLLYFSVTLIAFVIFGYWAKHSEKILFKLTVFKRSSFIYSFLPYVFLQFSNVGINFMLPNYVQMVNHASAFIGGLILFPGSLLNGFGQPVYGWLLDKYGGRLPLYLGNSLVLITAVLFMLMGQQLTIIAVVVLYAIFSTGRSMAFSNSMTFGLKQLQKDERNDANALYNTGQQVFGSIGTTLMAVLMMSVRWPQHTHVQNVALGSQIAFGLVGLLALLNVWFYRRLLKHELKIVA